MTTAPRDTPDEQPPEIAVAPPESNQRPAEDEQVPPPPEDEHIPPPPEDAQARPAAEDKQIAGIVNDNDVRLWYITKFGEGKFGDAELQKLVEVRNKFRNNPSYSLSDTEEIEYRKATMIAAEFLGSRHPEAIRLYANVQAKKDASPLRKWLWWIAIALLVALLTNGYQNLLGNQIKRMKDTRLQYAQEMTGLSDPNKNLANTLSSMCELTLVYQAAAAQLAFLMPLRPGMASGNGYRPWGVCEVIQTHDVEQGGIPANRTVIDEARRAEFDTAGDRAVRVRAESVDSLLNLFLLPMLYALLGALTSALRAANDDFKAMTLTRVDGINLGARVLLGVVGGATVGIVFSADTLQGAAGLTVLGLAFAVGYAVDLFFNLLDSIKLGLGGSRTSASKAS
ncbi:MAG: hypothetical protein QNJ92_17710 [Alphaproteobacteria bacterium]|nr:hypothetical protein [Alphaproteobacteria bacterium]